MLFRRSRRCWKFGFGRSGRPEGWPSSRWVGRDRMVLAATALTLPGLRLASQPTGLRAERPLGAAGLDHFQRAEAAWSESGELAASRSIGAGHGANWPCGVRSGEPRSLT